MLNDLTVPRGRRTNIDAFTRSTLGKDIPGWDVPAADDLDGPMHGPRRLSAPELAELARGKATTHYVEHRGRRVEGVLITDRFVGRTLGTGLWATSEVLVITCSSRAIPLSAEVAHAA